MPPADGRPDPGGTQLTLHALVAEGRPRQAHVIAGAHAAGAGTTRRFSPTGIGWSFAVSIAEIRREYDGRTYHGLFGAV